jgi:hypothetical protein
MEEETMKKLSVLMMVLASPLLLMLATQLLVPHTLFILLVLSAFPIAFVIGWATVFLYSVALGVGLVLMMPTL